MDFIHLQDINIGDSYVLLHTQEFCLHNTWTVNLSSEVFLYTGKILKINGQCVDVIYKNSRKSWYPERLMPCKYINTRQVFDKWEGDNYVGHRMDS